MLGENSFFHFGTYQEYIEHLLPNSIYRNSFPGAFKSNIVFSNGISKLPEQSFVEFSTGSLEVGKNSIVSGIDAGNSEIIIPSNTVVFTLALKTVKISYLYTKNYAWLTENVRNHYNQD